VGHILEFDNSGVCVDRFDELLELLLDISKIKGPGKESGAGLRLFQVEHHTQSQAAKGTAGKRLVWVTSMHLCSEKAG
jgi:hypothetical protein